MALKIAVIGAGAVGLSTAVQIQELIPSANVVIIADKFTTETTSHGAAGIFRPTLSKTPGVSIPQLKKWLSESWKHYDELAHSVEAGDAGVQITSGYQFVNRTEPNELERDLVYQYRQLTPQELDMFPGHHFKHGWFVTTMLVDPGKYLPYLTDLFLKKNGRIVKRKLSTLEELVGSYDLVVNCAGLGSQQLLGDTKMVPNRGHLVKVKAPWLKHFVYTGDEGLCYILPGLDMVHVGGTRTDNDTDLTPRAADHDRILAEACRVVPSLKHAVVLSDWVGLRPNRQGLRLEFEILQFSSGYLKVVHNYGHGGEGISLSWGTAAEAARLVKQTLQQQLKSKL